MFFAALTKEEEAWTSFASDVGHHTDALDFDLKDLKKLVDGLWTSASSTTVAPKTNIGKGKALVGNLSG